jgi:histidine triad (HIT) family protein
VPSETGCTFCRIVAGELPAHVVLDDERFLAFLDTRPLFAGHTLLVPRAHHETLLDLPADLHAPFLAATAALSRAVRDATGAAGFFNAMNNVVSQSVPHLHMHVVPRRPKDGLRGFFWPRTRLEDGEAVAGRIRAELAVPSPG